MVSNSVRKEALEYKALAGKLKDRVDNLSATSSSTTKSISELKMTVAAAKKAEDQVTSRFDALKK